MRATFKIIIPFICFLFVVLSFKNKADIKPAKILHQMYDSIKVIKTLRMKISALERVEKKFVAASSEIKLNTQPRKLYFVNHTKKIEILYNIDHSHKALVKPNVFPYMSLNLDPTGNLMRRNQHYTINELGFDFIGRSIALTISKDKEGLANFTYLGRHPKNNYNCYMLVYENKAYSYVDYTVGEKETTNTVASKLCVHEYLLREKNDLLNHFGYLKKGMVIKVPTLYCKKAILYIDERMLLPVSISLYDEVGLFENYDYSSLQINKPFATIDFEKNHPDYGF